MKNLRTEKKYNIVNHGNRIIKAFSALFLALLILSGCAAVIKMNPVVSEKLDCIFVEGEACARSGLRDSIIAVSMKKNLEGYLELTTAYMNISEQRIDIDPSLIEITAERDGGKAKALKVYSSGEWLKKIKTEEMWAMIGKSIEAFGDGLKAGRSRSTIRSDDYSYGATVETVDESKKIEARQRAQQEAEELTEHYDFRYQLAESILCKKTTLYPGYYIIGIVFAKYCSAVKYEVKIPVGSETHKIIFIPIKK